MNKELDQAATKAVTAPGYPTKPGLCQMFVRLTVESIYGKRFDAVIHQGSAKEAAEAFEHDGRYVVPLDHGSVPGDLLYKKHGSGGFGHVGIRVSGNRVAENSSVHITDRGDKNARGFRTLKEFGDFDVIVRLPNK